MIVHSYFEGLALWRYLNLLWDKFERKTEEIVVYLRQRGKGPLCSEFADGYGDEARRKYLVSINTLGEQLLSSANRTHTA